MLPHIVLASRSPRRRELLTMLGVRDFEIIPAHSEMDFPSDIFPGDAAVAVARAKGYAEDRKAKVHTYGKKEGKELTDFEAGIRSGYLQCQGDHAGLYKYKKALAEGKSKSEAREISRKKSK